jgi:hypothetical protein
MPNLKQRGIKILGRYRRRACRYRDNLEPLAAKDLDTIPIDVAFPGESSSTRGEWTRRASTNTGFPATPAGRGYAVDALMTDCAFSSQIGVRLM